LSNTDATVKPSDIAEFWVRFTQVIVQLAGGKTRQLGNIALDAGDYSGVGLVIDPAHTYVAETTGGNYLVKCPGRTQSGFKLNRLFTIDTTGWIDFIINFDLRRSLTLTRPNQPRADFDYILRPTLRILDTQLASTFIHGPVTDQRSEPFNPATPDACWVYIYAGDATSVVPDDICLDPDIGICPPADRPLLEMPVQYDAVYKDYIYDTGLINPGTYTLALVCEDDDPGLDDKLLLMGETDIIAAARPHRRHAETDAAECPCAGPAEDAGW